jgi:co-chaperonin GroES (HSP10)
MARVAALLVVSALCLCAQAPERMVGTIAKLTPETATIDVKSDDGKVLTFHVTSDSVFTRIAPGEKSLRNAQPIHIEDLTAGDRVLVNSDPATASARRLVVMAAQDISKHDEQDKAEWAKSSFSGIVVAKTTDEITLRTRETQTHVKVSATTRYRKYAADSVKFADAKASNLTDIQPGDQLRAKGEKTSDGTQIGADEVVFGTFLTKVGTITAVDLQAKTVSLKELNTGNSLTVRFTADSQLKKMPEFAGMPAGGGPPGGMQPPPGGHPPDMAEMLEHMPPTSLDEMKPGDTVVVSSTKGQKDNDLTAIVLLNNAGMLIRMATSQRPSGGNGQGGQMPQGGGMQGGLGNLELPGMTR